jgi:hypothetical protein
MTIKGKPNVDDFLDGGAAAEAPPVAKKKAAAAPAAPAGPKRQKLVELPEPVFEALKDRAYEEYKRTGKRVTETQIIIDALSKYLGLK